MSRQRSGSSIPLPSRWVVTAVPPHELGQAVLAYAALFFIKLLVYVLTGMLTVLALALHSLSDLVLSAFLLLSTRMLRAAAEPDQALVPDRVRSVAALVTAAVTISFVSFRLAEEAVAYLLDPRLALYAVPELAFALVLGSMLAGAVPLVRTVRAQRARTWAALAREPYVMAALNDELALLVGLAGIVLLNHGWRQADAWAALVIAALIAANAVGLAHTHLHVLLGRPATRVQRDTLRALAEQVRGVQSARVLDAQEDGGRLRATVAVTLARGTPIEEATAVAAAVGARLRAELDSECLVLPMAEEASAETPAADSAPGGSALGQRKEDVGQTRNARAG